MEEKGCLVRFVCAGPSRCHFTAVSNDRAVIPFLVWEEVTHLHESNLCSAFRQIGRGLTTHPGPNLIAFCPRESLGQSGILLGGSL